MSQGNEIVLGHEKGKLGDIDYFYVMIAELKKIKRNIATNFYMDIQQFKEAINCGEVKYEYECGKYLNLIVADDGFSRLYYYITETDDYHFEGDGHVCVCDIFFNISDTDIGKVTEAVCREGFRKYKAYHKLTVKNPKVEIIEKAPQIEINQGIDQNAIAGMYQYFDKYSDCLPRYSKLKKFTYEKKFLSLYDTGHQEFLGAMIYTQKHHSIIEEFIFIQEKARGRGLSILLSSYWYQMFVGSDVKFITWIRDDNTPSIVLHKRYNYQDANIKKITFLKG